MSAAENLELLADRIERAYEDGDLYARRRLTNEIKAAIKADPAALVAAAPNLPRWLLQLLGRDDLATPAPKPDFTRNPGSHYNRALRGED